MLSFCLFVICMYAVTVEYHIKQDIREQLLQEEQELNIEFEHPNQNNSK